MPRPTTRAYALLGVIPLVALVVGLLWLGSGSDDRSASPETGQLSQSVDGDGRPDIVVVMMDDMRVDELRFMPWTRRLMSRNGVTFENSFSPLPVCCPARASFLTGQYPHNHKVWTVKPPYGYGAFDDSATLATALHDAGYSTGLIGKYLNGYGEDRSKVSGEPSHTFVPAGWSDWRAALDNPKDPNLHGSTYRYYSTPFNVNGKVDTSNYGTYQTNVVGRMSRDMATGFAQREAPYFMYVNYVAPHHGGPTEPDDPRRFVDKRGNEWKFVTPARPPRVRGRFDDVVNRPAGLPRGGGPAEADVSDKPLPWRALPEPPARARKAMTELTRQRAESLYLADLQIKRLVRKLKETGRWSNTVLMLTSDNGYYLGEHREPQGKIYGHEPSLRVPFLVTGPGMRGGEKRYAPITTIDVTASILELAGAEPDVPLDGESRVDVFKGKDRPWTAPVLHEVGGPKQSDRAGFDGPPKVIGVRTPRYSMMLYENGGSELYDLLRDPAENHNRWRSPRYRDVRRKLMKVWWELKDCAGDACRAPLPESLRAGVDENRRLTRSYWKAIDKIYGWPGR